MTFPLFPYLSTSPPLPHPSIRFRIYFPSCSMLPMPAHGICVVVACPRVWVVTYCPHFLPHPTPSYHHCPSIPYSTLLPAHPEPPCCSQPMTPHLGRQCLPRLHAPAFFLCPPTTVVFPTHTPSICLYPLVWQLCLPVWWWVRCCVPTWCGCLGLQKNPMCATPSFGASFG